MKFYGYKKCDGCRKAMKALDAGGVSYDFVDVTEVPPTVDELKAALASGIPLKKLFNTSGQEYRARKIKDLLPTASEAELLDLLANTGRLVKRPFVIDGAKATVGYKVDAFAEAWLG